MNLDITHLCCVWGIHDEKSVQLHLFNYFCIVFYLSLLCPLFHIIVRSCTIVDHLCKYNIKTFFSGATTLMILLAPQHFYASVGVNTIEARASGSASTGFSSVGLKVRDVEPLSLTQPPPQSLGSRLVDCIAYYPGLGGHVQPSRSPPKALDPPRFWTPFLCRCKVRLVDQR